MFIFEALISHFQHVNSSDHLSILFEIGNQPCIRSGYNYIIYRKTAYEALEISTTCEKTVIDVLRMNSHSHRKYKIPVSL